MGLLQNIFGKSKDASSLDTLEAATAALERLHAEREAAEAVIAGAMHKRRALLLADAPDKDITALDAQTDAARLTLDRCAAAQPSILARIGELQSAERRALLATLETNLRKAEKALDAALDKVLDPFDDYLEAVRQLDVAGFEREAAGLVIRPPLIGEGVLAGRMALENWRRQREALGDARALASRPYVPPPAPVTNVVPLRREPEPPTPPRARREPIKLSGPVGPGYVRVRAVMDLVDFQDRTFHRGDEIDVLKEQADFLAHGCAFELVAIPENIEDAAQ